MCARRGNGSTRNRAVSCRPVKRCRQRQAAFGSDCGSLGTGGRTIAEEKLSKVRFRQRNCAHARGRLVANALAHARAGVNAPQMRGFPVLCADEVETARKILRLGAAQRVFCTSADTGGKRRMCLHFCLHSTLFPTPNRPQTMMGKGRERVAGIEPAWPAWKAGTLPLSYTRDAAQDSARRALIDKRFFCRPRTLRGNPSPGLPRTVCWITSSAFPPPCVYSAHSSRLPSPGSPS